MSEELISIHIWLVGRSYRIKLHPDEEAAVRQSVKKVDEKIMELRAEYAGKDDQDFLAMCLLMYATDLTLGSLKNPVLKDELDLMIKKIDQALKE